ncbi:MAG: hypothetical protein IPJ41_17170 [Phycisphaerales bacterium]|nr:hypothetical protein [Phycisphaerales bacterium]
MPVRCKHCEYDRTGLSIRMRCPECGRRRAYYDQPFDWGRLLRWPGMLVPVGTLLAVAALGAAAAGLIGWPVGGAAMTEGAFVIAMGCVNWN